MILIMNMIIMLKMIGDNAGLFYATYKVYIVDAVKRKTILGAPSRRRENLFGIFIETNTKGAPKRRRKSFMEQWQK